MLCSNGKCLLINDRSLFLNRDIAVLIIPYTKAASKQLKQDLAHFHASRALKMIEALHCPAEQKLELLDKIIENLKSSKDTYNDLDKAPTSSYQWSGC